MAKKRTPWLGEGFVHSTRPVQNKRPTARQVADTVIQEMRDPGYMVSFYNEDDINSDQALLILSRAVVKLEEEAKNRNE